ncbi:hypothetical protein R1flu_005413 [Riccia fluitans]|uniref:Uncharacterized protein n=1 Tax=Riccia fluitans TaxID=41844 RepID=A0ABD1YT36_9MARC
MSGIKHRSRRQSDVPSKEPPSQCRRCATSLIYELPYDKAMETIDRLVQGEETNSGVDAIVETNSGVDAIIEKIPTLQSMVIQPVVPTRLPRPPPVGFEELSLLTRDEVFPHLKFDRLKIEGIFFIDGSLFARGAACSQGQLLVNVSREGLKEYLVFSNSKDSSYVAQWDAERCELVRERDQLKEDLFKAQDILADGAQREEALRAEHKRLQEEYSQEKAAWENKNRKLEEEAQQLHEE